MNFFMILLYILYLSTPNSYHLNYDNDIFLLQLPDYHDIVKNPMDYGTIRKKLDGGLYISLEQFEVGVAILICLPDSVFARQPCYYSFVQLTFILLF